MGSDAIKIDIESEKRSLVWHVMNLAGDEAVRMGEEGTVYAAITVPPAAIRSPYVKNWTFYTSMEKDTPLTAIPDGEDVLDIYAYYEYDDTKTLPALDAGQYYTLQIGGTKYAYLNEEEVALSDTKATTDAYLWSLVDGDTAHPNDPYNIQLYNYSTKSGIFSSQPFVLMNDPTGTTYALMAAEGTTQKTAATLQHLAQTSTTTAALTTSFAATAPESQMLFEDVDVNYSFVVVDLSNKLAIQSPVYAGKGGQAIALDEEFQSPLAENYVYWRTYDSSQSTSAEGCTDNLNATLPYGDCTIYVTYTPKSPAETGIALDGSEPYILFGNSTNQRLFGVAYKSTTERVNAVTEIDYRPILYQWLLTGTQVGTAFDPYNVTFYNPGYHATYTPSENTQGYLYFNNGLTGNDAAFPVVNQSQAKANRLMILNGNAGYVEFRARRETPSTYQFLAMLDSDVDTRTGIGTRDGNSYSHGSNITQFTIQKSYIYHVIDLEGKEAISALEGRPVTESTTPQIPRVIRSSLVSSYRYYDISAFNHVGDTYTLKAGATELTTVAAATTLDIYVVYAKADIKADIDLTGQKSYNMTANPTTTMTAYQSATSFSSTQSPAAADLTTNDYLWHFKGGDPYNLRIYNQSLTACLSSGGGEGGGGSALSFNDNNNVTTFMLLEGSGSDGYSHRLMTPFVSGYNVRNYYYLGSNRRDGAKSFCLTGYDYGNHYYIGSNYLQIKLDQQNETDITYVILNNAGTPAVQMTVEGTKGVTPSVPEAIKSPLIADDGWHFWDKADAATRTELTMTGSGDEQTIYVTYDYNPQSSAVSLSGDTYYLKAGGDYLKSSGTAVEATATAPAEGAATAYQWTLSGDDPYAVTLKNAGTNTSIRSATVAASTDAALTLSATAAQFILLGGTQADHYELMAATGTSTDVGTPVYAHIGSNGSSGQLFGNSVHPQGDAAIQVQFTPSNLTYHIINLSGREALQYTTTESDLLVPDEYQSPLATNYRYYSASQFTSVTDGSVTTYTLKDGETDLVSSGISAPSKSHVFVTYEYDESKGIKLDGTEYYGMLINGGDAKGFRLMGDHTLSSSTIDVPAFTEPMQPERYYSWYLEGGTNNDPYDVSIKSVTSGNGYLHIDQGTNPWTLFGSTQTKFMLLNGAEEGQYEVVCMDRGALARMTYYSSDRDNTSSSGTWFKPNSHGTATCQVAIQPLYNYHVIDLSGKEAAIAPAALADGEAKTLALPQVISSPLVDRYSFYNAGDFTENDGIYTLKSTANPITILNEVTTGSHDIYAVYSREDINNSFDLTGQTFYNMAFGNKGDSKQFYFYYDSSQNVIQEVADPSDAIEKKYLWSLISDDPYNIQIYNLEYGTSRPLTLTKNQWAQDGRLVSVKYDLSDASSFILTKGMDDSHYELMLNVSGTDYTANYYHYLGNWRSRASVNWTEQLFHTSSELYNKLTLTPLPKQTYRYQVLDTEGRRALVYEVEQSPYLPLDYDHVPQAIRSPLIKGETLTFYTASQLKAGESNKYEPVGAAITETPATTSGTADIYIKYTYTCNDTKAVDLTGELYYHMKVTGDYAYATSPTVVGRVSTDGNTQKETRVWHFTGSDPYAMQLRVMSQSGNSLGAPTHSDGSVNTVQFYDDNEDAPTRFALLEGDGKAEGNYALAMALGFDTGNNHLAYLGKNGPSGVAVLRGESYDGTNADVQVQIEGMKLRYTYHIIDASDGITEIESMAIADEIAMGTSAEKAFPDALKRLGTKRISFSIAADDVYTNLNPNMRLGLYTDIYVGYEVVEEELPFKYSREEDIASGKIYWYNWKGTNSSNWDEWYYTKYDSSDYRAKTSSIKQTKGTVSANPVLTDDEYLWAFIGDPYRTKIINKATGAGVYLSVKRSDGLSNYKPVYMMGDATNYPYTEWGWTDRLKYDNFTGVGAFRPLGASTTKHNGGTNTGPVHLRVGTMMLDNYNNAETYCFASEFIPVGPVYKIVNLSEEVAITSVPGRPTEPARVAGFSVPTDVVSPAVKSENFTFNFANNRVKATDDPTTLDHDPYSFEPIYVFYTAKDVKTVYSKNVTTGETVPLKLNNTKLYNIVVGTDQRIQYAESKAVPQTQSAVQTTDDYLWAVDGLTANGAIDPYRLTLRNNTNKTGATLANHYILMNATSSDEDGLFYLMPVSDTDDGSTAHPYHYLSTKTEDEKTILEDGKTPTQVQFQGVPVKVTYNVVNLRNKLATFHTVTQEGGDELKMPEKIKSPLVEESGGTFTFHQAESTVVNTNTEGLDGKNSYDYSVTTLGDVWASTEKIPYSGSELNIYVTYDFDNNRSSIDLSGKAKYNLLSGGTTTKKIVTSTTTGTSTTEDYTEGNSKYKSNGEYLWEIVCYEPDKPDPYDIQIRSYYRKNENLNCFPHTQNPDDNGNSYGLGYWNMNRGTWQFTLVKGDGEGEYKFLALAMGQKRLGYGSLVKKDDSGVQRYWYLSTKTNGNEINVSRDNQADRNFSFAFSPADVVDVVYHLRHHVTGVDQEFKVEGQPVKMAIELPAILKRNYCDYTYYCRYTPAGVVVTKDDSPVTEEEVKAEAEAETKNRSDIIITNIPVLTEGGGEGENPTVNIYVDYKVNGLPFNLISYTDGEGNTVVPSTKAEIESLPESVFNLESYERRLEKAFSEDETRDATGYLYFMVMDTNDDFTKGQQRFLRRETNNRISYLSNDMSPHYHAEDNPSGWSYSRTAEAYRVNDHNLYQDKNWLWAFAGDPYDLYVFNLSGVTEEDYDIVEEKVSKTTYHPTHWTTYEEQTQTTGTTTTTEQVVATPAYTDTTPATHTWAITSGQGANSDATFSLATQVDNAMRYWHLSESAIDKTNELLPTERSGTALDYNLRVLPYYPQKYEDVNLVIRRTDEVDAWKAASEEDKPDKWKAMTSGVSELYYASKDRMFVAGDKIAKHLAGDADGCTSEYYEKWGDKKSVPMMAMRQFCKYTLYKDEFKNAGDYTIPAGTYIDDDGYVKTATGEYVDKNSTKGNILTTTDSDNYLENEDGQIIDGVWPSSIVYFDYEVTSDMFLKTEPTQTQVEEMVENNDHVYFIDFIRDLKVGEEAYNTGHHAYYDPERTSGLQNEKFDWNSTAKDFSEKASGQNDWEFVTTSNRMASVPEHLKWFFVGDPYHVKVYSTAKYTNDNKAMLRRYLSEESSYQAVIDRVRLRRSESYADYPDNREYLTVYDVYGNPVIENGEVKTVKNPNYKQSYYPDFTWEVVPSTNESYEDEAFALRFKASTPQLGYVNVYYYLAHDGLTRTYPNATGQLTSYNINLSYDPENARALNGKYTGYHSANNKDVAMRVVQPVRVYVSAFNSAGVQQTKDELSEYFALGETLTAVPRHLRRPYVKYQYSGGNISWKLTRDNTEHTEDSEFSEISTPALFQTSDKVALTYKFDVTYTMNDLTNDGTTHLFSSGDDESKWTWVDLMLGGRGSGSDHYWLYYDKVTEGTEKENKALVSSYPDTKSKIDADANAGWTTGLKGLHWALIGDPYKFTVVNRRSIANGNTDNQWLGTAYGKSSAEDKSYNYAKLTGSAEQNATNGNTEWGLVFCKYNPGGENDKSTDFIMRTSSLKKTENDAANSDKENNETNAYEVLQRYVPQEGYNLNPFDYLATDKNTLLPFTTTDDPAVTAYFTTTAFSLDLDPTRIQRIAIRTAVAKDDDGADNDCFDADVYVINSDGTTVLTKEDAELHFGDVDKSLPLSLRRYGCSYKCYTTYDAETKTYSGEVSEFAEPFTGFTTDATTGRYQVYYVYTVDEKLQNYFTAPADAKTDEYTWMNAYYQWTDYYSGTNIEVTGYKKEHDRYIYNAAGKVIGETFKYTPYTTYINGQNVPYTVSGYLNSHTGQAAAYADEGAQSENDRQKWALVGDPYSFTMTNYAQYLQNTSSKLTVTDGGNVVAANTSTGQNFTLAVDANGNTYLGVIDSDGNVTSMVFYDKESGSTKNLFTMGNGVDRNDPTGNTLDTGGAKPFFLASLTSFADIVQYHLVIAHQYSLEANDDFLKNLLSVNASEIPSQTTITDKAGSDPVNFTREWMWQARQTVRTHLFEFLKYQGLSSHNDSTYYLTYNTDGAPTGVNSESDVKALLKKHGSLRDIVSYPFEDYEVAQVAIGNRPQVPWFMKRQFCNYKLYQRDVYRSVIDYDSPVYQTNEDGTYKRDANGEKILLKDADGNQVYDIKWVSVLDESQWTECDVAHDHATSTDGVCKLVGDTYLSIPRGYATIVAQNGKILEKLDNSHLNRKVIVDVVYDVNTEQFRFADQGRNTTAWYSMMTNNETKDGLMNFSYKDGVGARLDRTAHYTNNYLWAPEGDPYGFVMRSRYATINGTGWDDVVVTTIGALPKSEKDAESSEFSEIPESSLRATYTSKSNAETENARFVDKRIVHLTKGMTRTSGDDVGSTVNTDGAANAIYEMLTGNYAGSFLMHPTSAWTDKKDEAFESYYMVHNTTTHKAELRKLAADAVSDNADANWRLITTPEQLLPYFEFAGYVGGVDPQKAASDFQYSDLREKLKSGTATYSEIDQARKLVYAGTFYKNDGKTVVNPTDERPTGTDLPMKFVATNLVNMKPGYYRIRAFSQEALDADGKDMSKTGVRGIVGPRYISGYRFESEKVDNPLYADKGGRWLHFVETDEAHATIHTWGELKEKIADVNAIVPDGSDLKDRDVFDHKAMVGNIDIPSAEYDPSSIFYFDAIENDHGTDPNRDYGRYNISTQGLQLRARAGDTQSEKGIIDDHCGHTMLEAPEADVREHYDKRFRLADIGGAAITIRTHKYQVGNTDELTGKELTTWDDVVAQNLKTNYLCIDRHYRYRITIHKDNEMVEIGEHTDGQGTYGIQDTKWRLQPVGVKTDWPYQQMPLRVEVHQGGKDKDGNEDKNYYGSLYVPFDTRLSSTVDVAFTAVTDPKMETGASTGTITMSSVSQHNQMGNPQYIPATWPVVLRTGKPKEDKTTGKNYVELYLPYDAPKEVDKGKIVLKGQYLEQEDISVATGQKVMVFGLPWTDGNGLGSHKSHEYDYSQRVGFYTNENWARGATTDLTATSDLGTMATVQWADARSATDAQRLNTYVYNNKVYYLYTKPSSAPTRSLIVALFDGEEDADPDQPVAPAARNVPWPCDVYDLQGRKVASQESPETLLLNHPQLHKGVYIFGGRKVIVK